MQKTIERSFLRPSQVRSFVMDEYPNATMETLNKLGVSVNSVALKDIQNYSKQYGMDAAPALITSPSITTPVQFLQHWIAEPIEIVTAAREIDSICGRTMAGTWKDEQIVQTVLERTGSARPYGDNTNVPLSSWNVNFETRTVVRFEEGCEVGILEEERASAMRLSTAVEKRNAAAESLAIELNAVGFYGYNNGLNKTYGFLNDPSLPNFVTVATGAGRHTQWSTKTFDEILADVRTAMQALRVQTGNLFKPERDASVMSVSVACMEYLTIPNSLGSLSVYEWLQKTYPKMRIESAVQLDAANGGANVFYICAEMLNNNRVVDQYVQEVFRLLGVEKKAKGFLEDYSNATAGIMFKQPIGVVRYTGI